MPGTAGPAREVDVSMRELIVLGTASQAPTRARNHNGYVLRWDDEVILFDPGEGSQRQLLHTGVTATDLTRICVTHFHGDHCLGLPGIIQRLSLDRVPHPVAVHFPAEGVEYFARLRHASSFHETAELVVAPIEADGQRIDAALRHAGGAPAAAPDRHVRLSAGGAGRVPDAAGAAGRVRHRRAGGRRAAARRPPRPRRAPRHPGGGERAPGRGSGSPS